MYKQKCILNMSFFVNSDHIKVLKIKIVQRDINIHVWKLEIKLYRLAETYEKISIII